MWINEPNLVLTLSFVFMVIGIVLNFVSAARSRATIKIQHETIELLKDFDGDNYEIVTRQWLISLLDKALEFEKMSKNYQHGNHNNDMIHMQAMSLMGYAKSTKSILKKDIKNEKDS